MPQQVIKLKGGSLNSTCLHINDDNKFVRKTISTTANREYGYVRWYSQLKKLQRFNSLIPGYVPKVYDAGITSDGAFFDIEYIEAKDIKTLFKENSLSRYQTERLHKSLWFAFDRLHSNKYTPNSSSLKLYFQEEVLQKLNDARQFEEFESFYNIDSYVHNGQTFSGIKNRLDTFSKLFNEKITEECYVHGNPTLENILYDPDQDKIVFIDLYEEGIVDSQFMDYSQVLQCSNSLYGLLNDGTLKVTDNVTEFSIDPIPENLIYFNELFNDELKYRYTPNYKLVKLFEATQFFRMLPFKCHSGNIEAAKFFYVHACDLVNKLL
jgi:serine/threonine protein kinase